MYSELNSAIMMTCIQLSERYWGRYSDTLILVRLQTSCSDSFASIACYCHSRFLQLVIILAECASLQLFLKFHVHICCCSQISTWKFVSAAAADDWLTCSFLRCRCFYCRFSVISKRSEIVNDSLKDLQNHYTPEFTGWLLPQTGYNNRHFDWMHRNSTNIQ